MRDPLYNENKEEYLILDKVVKDNKDYYLIKTPSSEAVVPLTHFAASHKRVLYTA